MKKQNTQERPKPENLNKHPYTFIESEMNPVRKKGIEGDGVTSLAGD